jgi:DNA-binding PadR family transcriptional regulator
MLDLAILGLLEERELHGYEIRRQLRDSLGLLANVSFGSLYPALARLEAAGAVEAAESPGAPEQVPAPPTGSLSGERAVLRAHRLGGTRGRRARKVYRITDTGRRMFAELLAGGGGADDARSFGLRLAFARHLAPQARLGLLERRRAQLQQRLDEVQAAAGRSPLDVYARSVVEHTAEAVAQDVRWLDRLIDAERQGATERPTSAGPTEPEPADRPAEPGRPVASAIAPVIGRTD